MDEYTQLVQRLAQISAVQTALSSDYSQPGYAVQIQELRRQQQELFIRKRQIESEKHGTSTNHMPRKGGKR